jgi:uncharacterized protein (TIGR00645 family)
MLEIEKAIETTLFRSRWLLAPLYMGLVLALVLLLVKFFVKFIKIVPAIFDPSGAALILGVLELVDVVLIANLLLIIIFSGYENFVSKIDMVEGHVDKPDWMGKVDYTALKLKVIGSIVAISSIELLKVFISVSQHSDIPREDVVLLMAIHLAFVISGVLFALMERILHPPEHHK